MTKRKTPWEQLRAFDMEAIPENRRVEVEALERWWAEHSAREAAATVPKAVEYGSSSLDYVGEAIARLTDLEGKLSTQELAITFYVFGKMARILAALERGEQPNLDHWVDIGVYTKMISYIRENGSWV